MVAKPQAPKCNAEDKQHGWIEWNGICGGCRLDPEQPNNFVLLDDSSRLTHIKLIRGVAKFQGN